MIEELRIRDLGVIEEADLSLRPGMVVLTGETGAGKTMVTTALSLLLGGKADSRSLRAGTERASVEAAVTVPTTGPLPDLLDEAGAETDDGVLLIARTVATTRSRGFLGGRAVPAAVLQRVGRHLVTVHGQNDQQRLADAGRRRDLLDAFAGEAVAEPLARYREALGKWQEARERLDQARRLVTEGVRESEMLRLALAEIESVDPQPGEEDELRSEEQRLAHAVDLRVAAEETVALVNGPPDDPDAGALSLVAAGLARLNAQLDHDPTLNNPMQTLSEAEVLLAEAASELASYAAGIEVDPARLEGIRQRRSELRALCRRFGQDVAEVLAWATQAGERLALIDGGEDRIADLEEECGRLAARCAAAAEAVTVARAGAGARLAAAAELELRQLAMSGATLTVRITQNPAEDGLELTDGRRVRAAGHGVDVVDILLSPHPGAPAQPIHQAASGGEMSRVMLALEVVLVESDPVDVLIFDEVDAGVGGRAAVEIGRRLARLARHGQVLVVTHLPQVAAFADQHLTVSKQSDGQITASSVIDLDDSGRRRELARMLAGQETSAAATEHAGELLDLARQERGTGEAKDAPDCREASR